MNVSAHGQNQTAHGTFPSSSRARTSPPCMQGGAGLLFASDIVGGVTEPAHYGLGLHYRRPLIGLAVGGFVGGVWAGATHVTAYIMGSSSFLSILGYVGGGALNTVNAGISDLLAMGIAAAVTYATWRDGTAQCRG